MEKLVICSKISEDLTIRGQVDQDCEGMLGNLLSWSVYRCFGPAQNWPEWLHVLVDLVPKL